MYSFSTSMVERAASVIKDKAKPKHGTGGVRRRNWSFNPKNDRPSAVIITKFKH
jgi:hypothetical protein